MMRLDVATSFACSSCGIRGNHFHEVHDNKGHCNSCGVGLSVEATYFEPALDELKKSVVILVESDASEKGAEIEEALMEVGLRVINSLNVIESNRLDIGPDNLNFLVKTAAVTFIVASQRMKSNGVVNAFLSDIAYDDTVDNLVPVYTNEESFQHRMRQLNEFAAGSWDGITFPHGQVVFDRSRLIDVAIQRVNEVE